MLFHKKNVSLLIQENLRSGVGSITTFFYMILGGGADLSYGLGCLEYATGQRIALRAILIVDAPE